MGDLLVEGTEVAPGVFAPESGQVVDIKNAAAASGGESSLSNKNQVITPLYQIAVFYLQHSTRADSIRTTNAGSKFVFWRQKGMGK